jgi:uncharacterized membrane protein YjjP (DUF1212 family)
MLFTHLIKEKNDIFINVRLLKTIKRIIEEAEERYLAACDNNTPLDELDKLEENYKKSLKLMELLESQEDKKNIKGKP